MHYVYKGELPRPGLVKEYGQTTRITLPCSAETHPSGRLELVADGAEFVAGESIGDITDPVTLRALEADPRFEAIRVLGEAYG